MNGLHNIRAYKTNYWIICVRIYEKRRFDCAACNRHCDLWKCFFAMAKRCTPRNYYDILPPGKKVKTYGKCLYARAGVCVCVRLFRVCISFICRQVRAVLQSEIDAHDVLAFFFIAASYWLSSPPIWCCIILDRIYIIYMKTKEMYICRLQIAPYTFFYTLSLIN